MVVEDDADLRQGIHLLLSDSEFDVVGEAPGAPEAIDLVDSLHPDIVVLDYRLPNATGREVGEAIKRTDPDVKVLVFSAYPDVADECDDSWADFFLLKTRIVDLPTALLYLASDPHSWGEPYSRRFEARR
jgi:DNA-binding NarL/FixJ family response regulator